MALPRPDVNALLAANAEFAKTYTVPPMMSQMRERTTDPIFIRKSRAPCPLAHSSIVH